MKIECDVVIVGAGIAGAGLAAELSRNCKVVVVEREEHPGVHATGRSAALHSEIYGNPCIRALTQASRAFFLQGDDGRPFATPRGCLHIATPDQQERLQALAREPAVAPVVTWVDAQAARSQVPVLKQGYVQSALAERYAYDLDVNAIHRFFLKRLQQNGGELHCSSNVSECSSDAGVWTLAAGDNLVRAAVLVNAAGAWGDELAKLAGAQPIGLQPLRRTALIVDAPAGVDPSTWPAVLDCGEQFYFKPEAGKILMSPADETPTVPCDAYPDDLDVAIAVDRVQRAADIPVRRIEHSWAGLRTFTADRTPVAGYDPSRPGFFWLVGQGGYGIQTSPALSRVAAALIRHERVPDFSQGSDLEAALSPARLRVVAGAPATLPMRSQS